MHAITEIEEREEQREEGRGGAEVRARRLMDMVAALDPTREI